MNSSWLKNSGENGKLSAGTVFSVNLRRSPTRFISKTRLQPMPRTTADGSCFAMNNIKMHRLGMTDHLAQNQK